MPITQSRLLSILSAGQDFERGFESMRRRAHQLAEGLSKGTTSIGDVQIELMSWDYHQFLSNHPISSNVLATEFTYFNTIGPHNERAKLYQQRKRLEAGITPRVRKRATSYAESQIRNINQILEAAEAARVAATGGTILATEQELTRVWNEAQAAKAETGPKINLGDGRQAEFPDDILEQNDSPFETEAEAEVKAQHEE